MSHWLRLGSSGYELGLSPRREDTYSRFRPANALTLSCKSRLPCRPPGSGAAAAATNTQWQERTGSRRDARVQLEPPEAARRPANGTAGFWSFWGVVGGFWFLTAVCV